MSKFNKIPDIAAELYQRSDAIKNYEGGLAFKLDPLTELYIRAASSFMGEHKFYTNARQSDIDLLKSVNTVAKIDPEFILQLAVYCREKLYLRSVPIALLAEFANNPECIGKVEGARKYVKRIIQRADELTELMSYQLSRNMAVPRNSKSKNNKRKDKQSVLPQMIKFGLAGSFAKFDAYQIAKYNKKKKVVKMRDVMFMSHPKPKDEKQKEVFKGLADKTLESPETWEVMRSTGKMTWHNVINDIFHKGDRVNNYMAIIRNLRNCLQDDSVTKEDFELLCKMVSDKSAVLKSKQLPFRFFSAYKELYEVESTSLSVIGHAYISGVMDAVETAVSISVDNFPDLGRSSTLIACDVSGSMEKPISKDSSIERFDVGIILGSIANRFCGHAITGMFGDIWKVVPMAKTSGILRNALEMHKREGEVGYSTNGYKVIEYLLDNNIEVDRIMIFTDCQMWDSESMMKDRRNVRSLSSFRNSLFSWKDEVSFTEMFYKYQRRNPSVKLYCFDLSGYGNVMIPADTKNVCLIGGFSDKVFDFMYLFEEFGKGNIPINKIKEIKP